MKNKLPPKFQNTNTKKSNKKVNLYFIGNYKSYFYQNNLKNNKIVILL